jgi:hypothetical protein
MILLSRKPTNGRDAMFYAKFRKTEMFWKTNAGRPAAFGTWNRSEAHVFSSREAAEEYGTPVPVGDGRTRKAATVNPSLAKAITRGGDGWTNRDDADEVLFGRH